MSFADADDPIIQTRDGPVVGRVAGEVAVFRGLRYAAPPVGPLRWRPPQRPRPWTQPRPALAFGLKAVQPPSDADPGVGEEAMGEDCLTLNLWAPRAGGGWPVMVWIHGGGFVSGSGSAGLYDGARLARRGVVVVTVNYRLGRLGFFDHTALAAERADGEPAGAYGLMDMIAALEWVRDSIGAFGGDPGRVTLFGQSAGGAAVARLMIAPAARGLFHRAVIQSGLGRERCAPLEGPGEAGVAPIRARGADWAVRAGLPPDVSAETLRAVAPERLLTPGFSFYGGDGFIQDGRLVREDVMSAFAAGRQAPIPLIIGSNGAEFAGQDPDAYPPWRALQARVAPGAVSSWGGDGAALLGDWVFGEPARALARLHARTGAPTFLYRFDAAGGRHGAERGFVFDNLEPEAPEGHQALAERLADAWARFAAVGDPRGGGLADWPDLREAPDALLHVTDDGARAAPVPFASRLDRLEALHR
ncbi:MAG: carboxylesterase/lipase family protein [Brevundimonas sp.]|uniref:carboxylesterase/lipase family protein n=1 Tax=Brevundimonas sp. TaxID=1871086 RepID=UPI0025BEB998|nr:carboxylesterase family protein [Brevundimonas sp.]MBX3476110.1 carboxylesterase/lipase family protein [Brevundimonas sp.]